MATTLVGAMVLIRFLSENGRCSIGELCSYLGSTDETLLGLVAEINDIDRLIERDGDELYLSHEVDFLDDKEIFKLTRGAGRVQLLDRVGSTNSLFLDCAENLVSGDVLVAEIQTAGRGRRSGKWCSEISSNLTMSMAWKFEPETALAGLSCAIGVAVADELRERGFGDVMVKWPNDLYIGDLKLAGILVESVPVREGVMTVIGLGLNVYRPQSGIMSDGKEHAYLAAKIQKGLRNELTAAIANAMKDCCRRYATDGLGDFIEDLKELDYLKGKLVSVTDVKDGASGIASGVDASGALILNDGDKRRLVTAGHVEFQ